MTDTELSEATPAKQKSKEEAEGTSPQTVSAAPTVTGKNIESPDITNRVSVELSNAAADPVPEQKTAELKATNPPESAPKIVCVDELNDKKMLVKEFVPSGLKQDCGATLPAPEEVKHESVPKTRVVPNRGEIVKKTSPKMVAQAWKTPSPKKKEDVRTSVEEKSVKKDSAEEEQVTPEENKAKKTKVTKEAKSKLKTKKKESGVEEEVHLSVDHSSDEEEQSEEKKVNKAGGKRAGRSSNKSRVEDSSVPEKKKKKK